MDLTREIYWNVGHGAATLIPMYALMIIALGAMVRRFLLRIQIYKQGLPLDRTDRLNERIRRAMKVLFSQKHVIQQRWPGVAHGLFFWGFTVLTIGTILVFVQVDVTAPWFNVKFLAGTVYLFFSLSLDIAGFLCLVMLVGLLVRRYTAPDGMAITRLDTAAHGVLLAILVTGFGVEGLRIAVTEMGTPLSFWSPVGLLVAMPLSHVDEAGLRGLHLAMWWLHLALVAGFIVLIPFTRLKHVVTTGLNHVFESLEPKATLDKLDLEDENAETFGATHIHELTWKDIFDTDACTACMRCQERCPAYSTDKPLSPMRVVDVLGDIAERHPEANLFETIGEDAIWSCTTCGACQDGCPAAIEHVRKIVEIRRAMVLTHATFPQELIETFNNLENQANPWGFGADSRADWAKDMDVPLMSDRPEAELLWFVGCAGSFDERGRKISRALARVLQRAGVDFAILGPEEACNGDMARRAGNEYLAQMLMQQNAEVFNQYKPKRILTGCPHCFNIIKNEYLQFDARYPVVSHAELLFDLHRQGRLKPNGKDLGALTFHDSCYLGRWNGIVEPPRDLLRSMNNGQLAEMQRIRENGFCCGAGGGRMFMEENLGKRINVERAAEVIATGAATVATACPFCATMLSDGLLDRDADVAVRDIAQLVDEATA
ncbi:heterodisulfide reductase-related iron-sulfur binding cluster [uncultured Desulfosarcina sp.]|uniref:heterodisulfide reductase-related iron-sulfur binding cluster n=1 Tax=uncultured Desulfosarcina sp. TaxID=218289 RepID=UPI0029C76E8B|nr:heterodisulfide reductase-related iron-sulfur binding cluster [uncultured Desulfosarcina sp.]